MPNHTLSKNCNAADHDVANQPYCINTIIILVNFFSLKC